MSNQWDDMTPEEREAYVNQDYVKGKYMSLDPMILDNIFDGEHNCLASCYAEMHIPEYDVQQLLGLLATRQKEAVSLIYLDGLTQERAASKMGISRRALRTHIIKARKRLTKCCHLFASSPSE